MPALREVLTGSRICDLAKRWKVDPEVLRRTQAAARQYERETGRAVWIISGWRSRAEQRNLARSGRPAALDEVSTHRSCPATGVDVSMGPGVTTTMKHTWVTIAVFHGLRAGGGSAVDPETLLPLDWNHVDLGPRS